MKKDLYTVFIFNDGARFYFKNNKLHREAGLAVIDQILPRKPNYEEIYINLGDELLYNKVFVKSKNKKKDEFIFKFSEGSEVVMQSPIKYIPQRSHYIEGVEYSEKDFKEYKILKLKEELDGKLQENDKTTKKLKI